MAARKRIDPRESIYLAEENATHLWCHVFGETRCYRRPVKGPWPSEEPNHRLLYLMAAAVFRSMQRLVPQRRWRKLLESVEAYADGEVTFDQLKDAHKAGAVDTFKLPAANAAAAHCTHLLLDDYKVDEGADFVSDAAGYLGAVAAGVLKADAGLGAAQAIWKEPAFREAKRTHERVMCGLIRDIFGNPYRTVKTDTGWFTQTATALAHGIYADKAFDRMPILADALQDAGCDSADILDHCRGPGPHVRGCWVVDLVLGKE
jgi:hypothetical protein